MEKGFIVEYSDGKVITEDEMEWNKVPKVNIKELRLKWYNKSWSVPGPHCFARKRGSASPLEPGMRLEARIIGYFDVENKSKVSYIIDELSGSMVMKVEEVK